MNNRSYYFFVLLSILIFSRTEAQSDTDNLWHMNFTKLADDVYAAYHSDPMYMVEGNVLFVINENDVIVFDGSGAQPIARNVINKIKELTDNPVSYLIISHGHEDHIRGIQEYVSEYPDIEILARSDTREYIDTRVRERIASFAERQKNNEQNYKDEIAQYESAGGNDPAVIDWLKFTYFKGIPAQIELYKNLELRLPSMVFDDDELTFYRGERIIKILYLGYGKTSSDLLLYLPNEKILATGDIVTEPIPYGFSKQPDSWLKVLNKINEIDADIIVPGHGKIMFDKSYIRNEIEMISYVNAEVERLAKSGMTLEEIQQKLDLSKYETQFTNGDPLAKYLFHRWYYPPHLENRFNQVIEEQKKQ